MMRFSSPQMSAPKQPNLVSVTTINDDGSRYFLHPADARGRWNMARRLVGVILIAIYVLLPWIPINGTVNGTLLAGDVAPFASGATEILAGARVELSEAAEVTLKFPQAPLGVWVDGQPVKDGRVRLEPGIHKIVVRHKAGGDLRFESSAGTFLPTW